MFITNLILFNLKLYFQKIMIAYYLYVQIKSKVKRIQMFICPICFEGTQSNRFSHLCSCRTFSLYLLPLDCLFRIVFTLSYHFLGLYQKLTLAHSNWSSRFCRYRAFWIHSISFPPCTQSSSPGKTIWTLCNWSCRSDLCR